MWKVGQVLTLAAVMIVGIAAGPGGAHAQYFGANALRVESEPAQNKHSQPLVRGYVYNQSPYNVANVRLGVEVLDARGQPTGAMVTGWVNGEISTNERRYFEVTPERAATAYRVSVQSFDLRGTSR